MKQKIYLVLMIVCALCTFWSYPVWTLIYREDWLKAQALTFITMPFFLVMAMVFLWVSLNKWWDSPSKKS